ncbi:RING finger protein 112 [Dissostichus eleginoides]|uniref:RING finger protein 112 n=1 Tax=Dissostichus eleginoides TaxID=100907 RepID=A0AAD9BMB4_DISEL|nr:RING finger protein 112 [Dissostichus eleginoides]
MFRFSDAQHSLCKNNGNKITGGKWPGVKGMERGGVSEACRVPTPKWRWHSKIMKNDDEGEEGMPRAHVHI